MKKREAYAMFEQTVLEHYEQQTLTLNVLDRLASHYSMVDIDSAGGRFLRSQDGKDLMQICIELVDPAFPVIARNSADDHDEYWEWELKKWEEIVRTRWNWQAYCAVIMFSKTHEQVA